MMVHFIFIHCIAEFTFNRKDIPFVEYRAGDLPPQAGAVALP